MKRALLVISLSLFTLSLMAAPIGEKRAREIATSFFASSTATQSTATLTLDLAWAGYDMEQNLQSTSPQAEIQDDALIYIYNRTDTKGFVIVAGDDCVERSIIAFSHENSFDTKDMAEGAKAMLQAWCEDIAKARKSNKRGAGLQVARPTP